MFLRGIARSLEGTPELEVVHIPIGVPDECLPDKVSDARLLAFDIHEASPRLMLALFKENPNMTLLALDPEGDRLVVLSPQVSGARTTEDLMEVIHKYGQGLPVNLPEARARPLLHDRPLVVSISRDRTLYLGERQLDLAGLGQALAAQVRERQGLEVLLKSDRDVPYGLVVQVMSTLKEAGVERLGVITSPAAP